MNRIFAWVCGVACGAMGMYFFDARMGGRRRSMVRDQITRAGHQFANVLNAAGRDLSHRCQGTLAEFSRLFSAEEAPDAVVVARVRSKLGRCVSHPHAIEVTISDGRVILAGPILEREVPGLLRAISDVRGVGQVESRLKTHRDAGRASGLQGQTAVGGEPSEWRQAKWSPAMRLLAGIGGGALIGYGCTRRFPVACALGTIGLGLLTRAVTNRAWWTSSETCCESRDVPRATTNSEALSRQLQKTWPF